MKNVINTDKNYMPGVIEARTKMNKEREDLTQFKLFFELN